MKPVKVGFFSLTGGAVSGDDAAYLAWHALDHLPEQYSIPGLRLGTRWRADAACVALRLAASDRLAPVRHAVGYRRQWIAKWRVQVHRTCRKAGSARHGMCSRLPQITERR